MSTDAPARTLEQVAQGAGQRADEIEQLRRLPGDLVDDLVATGVFRTWVPQRYGGQGGDVAALLDAIETVAYHDGATGWCVMIGGTTALLSGFLPPTFAEQIYGPRDAVTGGFAAPAGTARAVDGGLAVSGRWAWGSGTTHCTWIGGGVRIDDEVGQPAPLPDGTVAPFVFLDPTDVTLLDTWHSMGLRGTGSTDYEVDGAFVPSGRWVTVSPQPTPVVDEPLYRFSLLGALALGVASVAVGLARRAIDELVVMGTKRPAGSSRSLAERPVVQAGLAAAEADVRAARALLRATLEESWRTACAGDALRDEQKGALRLAATHAVARCTAAVDACHLAAGGAAAYTSSPLQRIFRDVHVASQHAMVAPRTLEPLGRAAFGLPVDAAQW